MSQVRARLPGVMRGVVEGGGARGSAVTARPSRPPGAVGRWARRDRPVQSSGAARAAAGDAPAPRPRFASITHLAWWDGISHAVTRPGSRARHLTPEIVPQPASTSLDPRARHSGRRARGSSDVLGGYPTISRTAAPGAAAPRTPRCAFRPRERRSDRRGGPTAHEWSEQESAAMNPLNNLPRSESLNI